MFAQSVLDTIKSSAVEYARTGNKSADQNKTLCELVDNLIGYKCCEQDFADICFLDEMLLLVSKSISWSKSKARKNSSIYNSNRHMALINLYETLQKKRETLGSAL